MGADFFMIGWFQIESLLLNHMGFILFDLRPHPDHTAEPKLFWDHARTVKPEDALSQAKEHLAALDQPLLLLCEDGEVSCQVAARLVRAGYSNLCVIEGGYKQLMSDWQQGLDA
jgi:rhodanese-related sulfurtransferase